MKKIVIAIWASLLLIHCGDSGAAPPVVLTKDVTTVVDLMDTDLVKKRDLLDCNLRLEGKPPHYTLAYSQGEIEVPVLAVKEDHDHMYFLVAVRAVISGQPVSKLLVPYNKKTDAPYTPRQGMMLDNMPRRFSQYEITVTQPENIVLKSLHARYVKERVVDHSQWADLESGAVMIRSHPIPDLYINSMNGLSGPENKLNTRLYYLCLAD